MNIPRPKRRSEIRRRLGRMYYTLRRRLKWYFGNDKYAKTVSASPLPFEVKSHQSLLLRPLKDVQMYLQHNKVENLRIAIRHIHNIIIRPGEVFSFWYLVGNPTRGKGYTPGLVLNQGKAEEGIGGGLCQLGNLIFWMSLHSPLTIKERYRHGFDVFPDINRSLPFGSGATLSYNYIDLQLGNQTQQSFQLRFSISEEYLEGEIRSDKEVDEEYNVYESDHRIVHQGWGGYTRHNRLHRKVFVKIDHSLKRDELVVENHAIMMYEPLLEAH